MNIPTLPRPKLGNVSAFTISSPDLEKSLAFYQKLGFSELFRSDFPFPLIQISDGSVMIMLRKDNTPYIALTYYVNEIEKTAEDLEKNGIEFNGKPKAGDMIKRYLLKSPDGFNISLVSFVDGFTQPTGPTMLTMQPADLTNPDKYPNIHCGVFGEYAQPVKNLDQSVNFWEKLGFQVISKFTSPYHWAIMSDGLNVIGLHQNDHFSAPTITYFAADMKLKIENLQAAGLPVNAAKDQANITLTTPEQQHINLFKLGM